MGRVVVVFTGGTIAMRSRDPRIRRLRYLILLAVVAFLLWVYLQAVILLYGADFSAAYARLRQEEERRASSDPGA